MNHFSVKLTLLLSLLMITACQNDDKNYISIKNTLNTARTDARITISRDNVPEKYAINGSSIAIRDSAGKNVPFQLDDLDGDGQWDEMALLYSLKPHERAKLFLEKADSTKERAAVKDRANIWFAKRDSTSHKFKSITHEVRPDSYTRVMKTPFYYQFEGPGWENDRVGFRMYFDARNAFDIWGKTTDKMILNQVGTGENYHKILPWGTDVLHVGNSLGAGSIAVIHNDSLYHLGKTKIAEFKQIANGPVRAIFDLTYKGWKVGDKNYSVRERITIWGGQPGFHNSVSLLNPDEKTLLVTGVVTAKLPGKPEYRPNGSPFPYVATWGKQSEHDDILGMAVVGQSGNFKGYGRRQENPGGVDYTAFMKIGLSSDHPVEYNFVTGWQGSDKKMKEKQYFMEMVNNEGERLNNPVEITYH